MRYLIAGLGLAGALLAMSPAAAVVTINGVETDTFDFTDGVYSPVPEVYRGSIAFAYTSDTTFRVNLYGLFSAPQGVPGSSNSPVYGPLPSSATLGPGMAQRGYLRIDFSADPGPFGYRLIFTIPTGGNLAVTNIETPAIPEPATWLTIMAGFGLTGAALRRRRATVAA